MPVYLTKADLVEAENRDDQHRLTLIHVPNTWIEALQLYERRRRAFRTHINSFAPEFALQEPGYTSCLAVNMGSSTQQTSRPRLNSNPRIRHHSFTTSLANSTLPMEVTETHFRLPEPRLRPSSGRSLVFLAGRHRACNYVSWQAFQNLKLAKWRTVHSVSYPRTPDHGSC